MTSNDTQQQNFQQQLMEYILFPELFVDKHKEPELPEKKPNQQLQFDF